MRTEQHLRDAFTSAAEQTPDPEPVLERILARTSPTSWRRRKTVLVLAAAVVAVLALVLPSILVHRDAVPADPPIPSNQRVAGNWNSVFRVDLEPDWKIVRREIRATTEDVELRVPAEGDPYPDNCQIRIMGPAQPTPAAKTGHATPVDVNGRPGLQVGSDVPGEELVWLYWPYQDDAWAQVTCDDGAEQNLEIARRLVFERTPIRVPVWLRSLPEGYQVSSIAEESYPDSPIPAVSIGLTGKGDAQRQPGLSIDVYRGATTRAKSGTPGNWVGAVNGLPAVFDADARWLSLSRQQDQVLLETDGGMAGIPRSRWPEAFRNLTVDIAERIQLVEDLTSKADWPDANQAIPS